MAKNKDAEKRQRLGGKASGADSGNRETPRQPSGRPQAEQDLREAAGARGAEQETAHRVELSRRDIIFFEQRLKSMIQSLVPFKGHSIHFPRTAEERPADWRRDESRLLLPLPSPGKTATAPGIVEKQEAPMGNGMAQASAAAKVSSGRTLPSGFSRGGGSPQVLGRKEGQSPLTVHARSGAARPDQVISAARHGPDAAAGRAAAIDDGVLGVFVARGVEASRAEALLPFWPEVGRLITDNLLQYKRSICDPVTGLFSRHYLLECLAREIETLRYSLPLPAGSPEGEGLKAGGDSRREKALRTGTRSVFHPGGEGLFSRGAENSRRVSVGVLVARFAALRDVVREFGYQFADELMIALAEALAPLCPEQALAARTGDFEFALCLPAATPKECNKLAVEIAAAMRRVSLVHPLRRERVGINASVGFILYPQDMAGEIFLRPPAEQARLTLRKARLAAALADDERPLLSSRQGAEPVLAFSRILAEGGRVLEVLPLSRVMLSLGANMHAREGQRFSVWSIQYPVRAMGTPGAAGQHMAPLYKGELVIMEVRENASQAEVISLGDPSWSIEPGDRLVLLPEEQGSAPRSMDGEERRDPDTGLLRHGDFFAKWAEERESCDNFVMALLRIGGPLQADRDPAQAEMQDGAAPLSSAEDSSTACEDENESLFDESGAYPGQSMARVAAACRETLGQKTLGGRFGLNSLIFFHPGLEESEAAALYEKLAAMLEESLGLDVAVGLACHPYLNFRKADAPENCRKALEYAMLLPRPHVGALDSLALNISADKLFSQGDSFGAIKEYQQALLADESNGMAWNSLGICLAGLGRHAEAERNFATALVSNADDVMAMYNLGYMHQSQGRDADAETRYNECLAREPEHLFALMRLGQLAENKKDNTAARAFYEKAAALPGGKSLTRRHFAKLCLSEGKQDEAREHLHEALLYDPQDAVSLQLLARLYLDAGEDPDLAAGLARQSVSLRPGLKAGWLELARALEAMGRDMQAKEARLRAGEV